MPYLKFYENERKILDELKIESYEITLSQKQVMIVASKLCRHFKFREPEIRFYGTVDNGAFFRTSYVIRVSSIRPSLGVIIHELAHAYNRVSYGNSHHNKKLMRTIKRFSKYCNKMSYWNMENKPESNLSWFDELQTKD